MLTIYSSRTHSLPSDGKLAERPSNALQRERIFTPKQPFNKGKRYFIYCH